MSAFWLCKVPLSGGLWRLPCRQAICLNTFVLQNPSISVIGFNLEHRLFSSLPLLYPVYSTPTTHLESFYRLITFLFILLIEEHDAVHSWHPSHSKELLRWGRCSKVQSKPLKEAEYLSGLHSPTDLRNFLWFYLVWLFHLCLLAATNPFPG